MTKDLLEKCYSCCHVVPIIRDLRLTEDGICDIIDDGQTCFSVHLYNQCIFEQSYKEISKQEIAVRDTEAIESHKHFEKVLKQASKEVASWPEWKQRIPCSALNFK